LALAPRNFGGPTVPVIPFWPRSRIKARGETGDAGMHCIYEVRYDYRWHSTAPDQWECATVRVLAGLDAQEAVDKARAAALKMRQLNDNGVEERCTGFRLREVHLVADAAL
jgi:hypothetical protein